MKEKSCATCRFSSGTNGIVNCKRHAPFKGRESSMAAWPLVQSGDWCGDWEEKKGLSCREVADAIGRLKNPFDSPAPQE